MSGVGEHPDPLKADLEAGLASAAAEYERDDYGIACDDCARTFPTWPDYTAHVIDTHGHAVE